MPEPVILAVAVLILNTVSVAAISWLLKELSGKTTNSVKENMVICPKCGQKVRYELRFYVR